MRLVLVPLTLALAATAWGATAPLVHTPAGNATDRFENGPVARTFFIPGLGAAVAVDPVSRRVLGGAPGNAAIEGVVGDMSLVRGHVSVFRSGSPFPQAQIASDPAPHEATIQPGSSVDTIADVDGDGAADWIVGDPCTGALADPDEEGSCYGAVRVLSGADLHEIDWFHPEQIEPGAIELYGAWLGRSVAVLGDVDGVPGAELVASAPTYTRWDGKDFELGRLYVMSAVNGALTVSATIEGHGAGDWLAGGVAALGDLDGDGAAEFGSVTSRWGFPHVTVWSGADPELGPTLNVEGWGWISGTSWQVATQAANIVNGSVEPRGLTGVPDQDQDQVRDFVVAATGSNGVVAVVLSGVDGHAIKAIRVTQDVHGGGLSVAADPAGNLLIGTGAQLAFRLDFRGRLEQVYEAEPRVEGCSAPSFGASVALVDVDGDRLSDAVIGDPQWCDPLPRPPVSGLGRIYVFGTAPPPVQ